MSRIMYLISLPVHLNEEEEEGERGRRKGERGIST